MELEQRRSVGSLFEFEFAQDGLNYNIKVEDVGNAEVHDIVTLNEAANLIESIVDCQTGGNTACVVNGEDLIIRLTNGGNILCPNGRRRAQSSAILMWSMALSLLRQYFALPL